MAIENINDVMNKIGGLAKIAAKRFAQTSEQQKNLAIQLISESLLKNSNVILEANKRDIDNAKKKNIATSMLDRLLLNKERIYSMAKSLDEIIKIKDPINDKSFVTLPFLAKNNREYIKRFSDLLKHLSKR